MAASEQTSERRRNRNANKYATGSITVKRLDFLCFARFIFDIFYLHQLKDATMTRQRKVDNTEEQQDRRRHPPVPTETIISFRENNDKGGNNHNTDTATGEQVHQPLPTTSPVLQQTQQARQQQHDGITATNTIPPGTIGSGGGSSSTSSKNWRSATGALTVQLSDFVNDHLIAFRYGVMASVTLLGLYGVSQTPLLLQRK